MVGGFRETGVSEEASVERREIRKEFIFE